MKVKSPELFIGHSHEDMRFINYLEKHLSIFGIKSFVAHRDITPSKKMGKGNYQCNEKMRLFCARSFKEF